MWCANARQEGAERFVEPQACLLGRERQRDRTLTEADGQLGQQTGQHFGCCGHLPAQLVFLGHPDMSPERLYKWEKRGHALSLRGCTSQDNRSILRSPQSNFVQKPALAHTRFSCHQHDTSTPVPSSFIVGHDHGQLPLSSNHRSRYEKRPYGGFRMNLLWCLISCCHWDTPPAPFRAL